MDQPTQKTEFCGMTHTPSNVCVGVCVCPLNLQTSWNGTSECFVGDAKWRFYFMFLGDSNGWG